MRDRDDVIKFALGCFTLVLIVACITWGIHAANTQTNAIEYACYVHGGHMQKIPFGDYVTCIGQTR